MEEYEMSPTIEPQHIMGIKGVGQRKANAIIEVAPTLDDLADFNKLALARTVSGLSQKTAEAVIAWANAERDRLNAEVEEEEVFEEEGTEEEADEGFFEEVKSGDYDGPLIVEYPNPVNEKPKEKVPSSVTEVHCLFDKGLVFRKDQ